MFLGHSRLTGRLDLLSYCAPDGKSVSPTWVPDWVSRGSGMFVHSPTHSQAAGLSKAYLLNNETDELGATGLLVAKISTFFAELPVSSVRSAATWLRALVTKTGTSDTYPTGETMYTALLKVLSQNETKERFQDRWSHEYIGLWVRGLQNTTDEILSGISNLIPSYEMVLAPAIAHWGRRRFFVLRMVI